MKPAVNWRNRFAISLWVLAPLLAQAAATPLRVGVAEVDIPPPVGHRMAGYFNERLATGTHDPLKARAFVLQQGRRKLAFAFCDLVGISRTVSTNARARASRLTGIPVPHVLISCTHTHTGPLYDDGRRDYLHERAVAKFGKDPQEEIFYPAFLADQLVAVLAATARWVASATLAVTIARQEGLSFNRRYQMKNGSVVFNPGRMNPNIVRPTGPADPDVNCLFVRSPAGGEAVAGITVFACHCDTVGGTEYRADHPYFLQETLRAELGGRFMSAFAAGTCGDVNQISNPSGKSDESL